MIQAVPVAPHASSCSRPLDARAKRAKPPQLRDGAHKPLVGFLRSVGLLNVDRADLGRPVRLDRRFCGGVFFHGRIVASQAAKRPSRKTPENFFVNRERVFEA
jgi:hypothetical protein